MELKWENLKAIKQAIDMFLLQIGKQILFDLLFLQRFFIIKKIYCFKYFLMLI